jgi:hypothetical protein
MHHPVDDAQVLHRHVHARCGALQQELARLSRGQPQRHGGALDRRARGGRPLVGRAIGVAHHHRDALERHLEFLGDDLGQRSAQPGAEVDVAVAGGDAAVRVQLDERVHVVLRHAGVALARGWRGERKGGGFSGGRVGGARRKEHPQQAGEAPAGGVRRRRANQI